MCVFWVSCNEETHRLISIEKPSTNCPVLTPVGFSFRLLLLRLFFFFFLVLCFFLLSFLLLPPFLSLLETILLSEHTISTLLQTHLGERQMACVRWWTVVGLKHEVLFFFFELTAVTASLSLFCGLCVSLDLPSESSCRRHWFLFLVIRWEKRETIFSFPFIWLNWFFPSLPLLSLPLPFPLKVLFLFFPFAFSWLCLCLCLSLSLSPVSIQLHCGQAVVSLARDGKWLITSKSSCFLFPLSR